MANEERPKNLRRKLLDAMAEVGSIAKAGKNKEQGYAYQKAADIFETVQAALVKHGIAFLSSEESVGWPDSHTTAKGATMFVCHATLRFTLLDIDSDEKIEACHSGEGFDTSDKALNKAKTAALKYFLKQTLLIGEDEDDSETDSHEVQTPACPKCGVVGAINKDREKPEWYCWKKRGGCGERFNYDPAKPPVAPAPETPSNVPPVAADVERALPLQSPPAGAPVRGEPASAPQRQQLWKLCLKAFGNVEGEATVWLQNRMARPDIDCTKSSELTKQHIAKLTQELIEAQQAGRKPEHPFKDTMLPGDPPMTEKDIEF